MNNRDPLEVLIIDDEIPFAEILRKRLSKRGLAVRIAHDGQDGVQALKQSPADIVVLDMRMPGMSGVETLRAIKEFAPRVEVIFLTGFVDADSALQGLEMGAFDYCLKPIEIDALYDKLLDAAERKRMADDS